MKDVRNQARQHMKGFCKVCPVCDGRACVGQVPGMGGLGTASSFKNNIEGLAAYKLNMRLLHDVKEPSLATQFLGFDMALPVMAAPIGGVSYNMGTVVSEQDYIDAIVNGCNARGVVGCTGDGVPPHIHESGFASIKAADGRGIPFIKPWDSAELDEKLDKALATGCKVIGMDVDAAGLITLRLLGRPVAPKSPVELKAIVDKVHAAGATFILKGVMTADDAIKAAELGVDAIIVSNHGGRVLDHTPATATVLPAIVDAVRAYEATNSASPMGIMVDGGVRDGADIFKMLALGADMVLIGRPFSVAAIGGLEEGVTKYLDQLKAQLTQAMVLTGCPDIASISRAALYGL
ncbi:MAG: alpha-hydroxy-acid oxidizing protein [Pseudomonadota bacterium]